MSAANFAETQAANGRLRALLDLASDGIHVLDRDGRVIECSHSFARMLGYSHEEALRLNVADWDAQFRADQLIPELRRLMGEPATTFQTQHRRKDGTTFVAEIHSTGIVVQGERHLYASARDVSERHADDKALKESEARYRRLYTSTPALMHSIDRDGVILSVSDLWLQALGYRRDEVIGKKSVDFLTEESRRYALETALPAFFKTGSAVDVPYLSRPGRLFTKEEPSIIPCARRADHHDEQPWPPVAGLLGWRTGGPQLV